MTTQIFEYEHSPLATLDYGIDWNAYLITNELIISSTWNIDAGVSKSSEQILNGVTSLFITGGVINTIYKLVNIITTSQGRTDARTIKLSCSNK